VVALVALLAGVQLVPSASGSRFLLTGIFDDAHVLDGNTASAFSTLSDLNVRMIRLTLWWGGPKGVATAQPENATDPADPAYDWKLYDRAVRAAASAGIRVMLTILGTPTWESGSPAWNVAPANPSDLEAFAHAAARRYDGTYSPAGGSTLPRVRYWTAWNEPNSPVFLRPQYRRVNGRWRIQSAVSYARICNAIVLGVKSVTVSRSLVACGVTAPRGNNQPGASRSSVSPLVFLRAMKSAGARGFDAYAHHPYYGAPSETPSTPPPRGLRGQAATAVTMGNLNTLIRELTRLYGSMRVWITEYGYQTNPPDRTFGVSWKKQADYLEQAWQLARRNPRVDVFLWVLLQDEVSLGRWQSGLISVEGERKPAFDVFAHLLD
jgi:hypothetical protein